MPASLNMTLTAASPLISYNGNWSQQISNDPRGTFSFTMTRDASATFEFFGKWVRVVGSKNQFHGKYMVQVDGETHRLNAATPSDSLHTPIFGQNVPNQHHTIVVTNAEDMTLNIHSIDWACDIGSHNSSDSAVIRNTTVDNNDPSFSYSQDGSWSTKPANIGDFLRQTGHSTSTANASVNFTFSGDAIAIYGTSGPNHAQYRVSRAEQTYTYDAKRPELSSRVLLYFAKGFGPGNNTVTFMTETPGLFEIDSAEVFSTSSDPKSGNTPGLNPSPGQSTSSSSAASGVPTLLRSPNNNLAARLSDGTIAAISFVGILVAFLLVAIWLLLRRNKRLWMRLQRGYMVQSQFDPSSPPSGVTPLIYSRAPTPQMRQTRPLHLAQGSGSSAGARAQRVINIQPTPPPARDEENNYPNAGDESFEAPELDRATTMASQMTASTLVAEAGSLISRMGSRYGLKLQLTTRLGSSIGTPTTAVASSSPARDSRGRSGEGAPRYSPWLRPDSEFYDPFAASIAGLEEVPEERVEDILRQPIQQHARGPSRGESNEWLARIP